MAAPLSWLDLDNPVTPEVMQILTYFCKDTTERIIRNAQRLGVGGALRNSIHATVYQNAGGNDALIRFYYLNYAGYLEQGLGYIRGIDDDLTDKNGKKHGVKAVNVHPVDPISGPNFAAIPATIHKATKSPSGDPRRGQVHKARPFLHSEIRLHLRGTQKRLAMACAYTATAYLTRGMVAATMQLTLADAGKVAKHNQQLLDNFGKTHTMDELRAADLKGMKSYAPGFRFVADMGAEEAWLKAKGYLKAIENDWGLRSFRLDPPRFKL